MYDLLQMSLSGSGTRELKPSYLSPARVQDSWRSGLKEACPIPYSGDDGLQQASRKRESVPDISPGEERNAEVPSLTI